MQNTSVTSSFSWDSNYECLKWQDLSGASRGTWLKSSVPCVTCDRKLGCLRTKVSHKHIHECLTLSSVFALEYLFLCQPHTAQLSGYLQPGMNQYTDATPTLHEIVEQEWLLFATASRSSCLLTKMCLAQRAAQVWKAALLQWACRPRGGHRKGDTVKNTWDWV